MPVATSSAPVDTVNGPENVSGAKRPRKPKRLDSGGKPMHRLVMVVSEDDQKTILNAIADQAGQRFVKEYVFGTADKEEFLGSELAEICKNYNAEIE